MKKVGLVLGGGGARGYAHIGVLKILEKYKIHVDMVVGASMGSIVGACYASGMPIEEIEKRALEMGYLKLIQLLDINFPRQGLISGKLIEKFLNELIKGKTFNELKIPLIVTATDIVTGKEIVIKEGSVAKALRASISIPGIFTPVKHDEYVLADGSIINFLPVNIAREMGADIIIAVDVSSDIDNADSLINMRKAIDNIKDFFAKNRYIGQDNYEKVYKRLSYRVPDVLKFTHKALKLADMGNGCDFYSKYSGGDVIIIRPDVNKMKWYNFNLAKEGIDKGKVAALSQIGFILKKVSS